MKSRRNYKNKQNKTRRSKSGKTLNKSRSFTRTNKVFKTQALANVRKLFGALPQKN